MVATLGELDTRHGVFVEGGEYGNKSLEIEYVAQIGKAQADRLAAELRREMQSLQDALDEFNFTRSVTVWNSVCGGGGRSRAERAVGPCPRGKRERASRRHRCRVFGGVNHETRQTCEMDPLFFALDRAVEQTRLGLV